MFFLSIATFTFTFTLKRITQGYAFRVLESLCWRSLHDIFATPPTIFAQTETSGGVARCRLFSRASTINVPSHLIW